MRKISVGGKYSKTGFALVDDEDYAILTKFKWHANKTAKSNIYATTEAPKVNGKRQRVKMHRFILGLKDVKVCVDHIDGDGLNNQRNNLRICTQMQNTHNRRKRGTRSTSKYLGVSFNKRHKKWRACIKTNGKSLHIGAFINEIDAAKAYNKKALELRGEFAKLNII